MTTVAFLEMIAPSLTSGVGAIIAVKLAYARIREDIADLRTDVDELKESINEAAIQNAKDHGEVQAEVRVLRERMDNLRFYSEKLKPKE